MSSFLDFVQVVVGDSRLGQGNNDKPFTAITLIPELF